NNSNPIYYFIRSLPNTYYILKRRIIMAKKTIYFLCTGNSCRSQMAEGWAKKYLGDDWEVRSAGIEVHGLNPNAVKAMKEVGVDISSQKSEIIDTDYLNNAT